MSIVVTVLHVLACFVLIVVVLLQTGKGADIGAVFGGSSQTIFGSSGAGNLLTRLTTWTAVLFMFTSLFLTWNSTRHITSSVVDSIPSEPPAVVEPAAPADGASAPAEGGSAPAEGAAVPARPEDTSAAPAAAGTGATAAIAPETEPVEGAAVGAAGAAREDGASKAAAAGAGNPAGGGAAPPPASAPAEPAPAQP